LSAPRSIDPALLDTSFDPRATIRAGEVNAHTHLYSGLVSLGMPAPPRAPQSFVEILELVWWRLDRALDEASLRASARLYLAEALLAGTTLVIDHHESPRFIEGSLDVLAEEAQRLGARLVVAYGATERNEERDEAQRGLDECTRFIRAERFARVRGLIGLHASFTVSDETVREAGEMARALGVGVQVHVAEDRADVEDAKRRGYEGPLERLISLGALPPGSIVAHGVWLDEASVRRVDDAGAWLIQNPRSNANNRVGYPRALRASTRVAIGTDGFDANMPVEHAALLSEARAHDDPAEASMLDARRTGAWRLAAELFGKRFDDGLAEGSAGDVIVGVPGEPPRTVIVDGQLVVHDGRLVRGDLEEIRAYAREQAARLWARMAAL
jgi:cytosine/adenosine deaminase-related metal-dependent hydrolase